MQPIHATDLRTYLECRRRYKYAIIERLKPREHKNPDYFDIGTVGHKVLREHYLGNEDCLDLLKDEQIEEDHKQLVRVLFGFYRDYYKEKDKHFQIAAVENVIRIDVIDPLNGDVYPIEFTMDLLILDTEHKPKPIYVIMDHKFYKSFPDGKVLDHDFQINFYYWAARKSGIKVKEFLLNVIKKSAPQYPDLLKNGGLSRSQVTLNGTEYELYLKAIELYNLNPADYSSELTQLKNRGSSCFKRYQIVKSPQELELFEEQQLLPILREIKNEQTIFFPIGSLDCKTCPFEFLCSVESTSIQENIAHTKKTLFVKKEEGER